MTSMRPNVDGVVAFPHGEGCGHAFGPDTDQLRRTLGGVLDQNLTTALSWPLRGATETPLELSIDLL